MPRSAPRSTWSSRPSPSSSTRITVRHRGGAPNALDSIAARTCAPTSATRSRRSAASDRGEPHDHPGDGRESARHLHRGHRGADFEPEALEVLQAKKNLRVLKLPPTGSRSGSDVGSSLAGCCCRRDRFPTTSSRWRATGTSSSASEPSEDGSTTLIFVVEGVPRVKSNAIVLTKGSATVGIGVGQVDRVDSCRSRWIARAIARPDRSRRPTPSSPLRIGPQVLIDAGSAPSSSPRGSVRDQEVIDAARDADVTMFFTGERHFFH